VSMHGRGGGVIVAVMSPLATRPVAPPFLAAFVAMHDAMRRDLVVLPTAIRRAVERDDVHALRRWFGHVRATIEHHHHLEDDALWPELDTRLPGFLAGTTELTTDHHRLDDALDAVSRTLAELTDAAGSVDAAVVAAAELHELLTDHLDREEAIVFGPIGKVFTADEYCEWEARAAKGTPFALFAFGLPWLLDGVEPATQRVVLEPMPAAARLLFRPFRWWYERIAAPVRGIPDQM
ncbi:MAG: hemerythrin domain-containing protein, partial [Ilumatobacteraceae bacterium]